MNKDKLIKEKNKLEALMVSNEEKIKELSNANTELKAKIEKCKKVIKLAEKQEKDLADAVKDLDFDEPKPKKAKKEEPEALFETE